MTFIVAIDGPAGTGKSSVAKAVASSIGLIYVDTGAIYRALAVAALQYKVGPEDEQALMHLVEKLSMEVSERDSCTYVRLDGHSIEDKLRSEQISVASSLVSSHQKVRRELLHLQRKAVAELAPGAVVEGRDIGTVVFPHADVKIFITASAQDRAKRRHRELLQKGEAVQFEAVLSAIEKRDQRDKERAAAPLIPAADALVLDTSSMSKEEVINWTQQIVLLAMDQKRAKERF